MSLLDEYMQDCTILNKIVEDDGYGGTKTTWSAGATIKCAIVEDNSIEAKIGQTQGVTSLYTITTSKSLVLDYHDVLKRLSDGKIFRITSNGDDNHTPDSASLNMRQVSAEEWKLPNG